MLMWNDDNVNFLQIIQDGHPTLAVFCETNSDLCSISVAFLMSSILLYNGPNYNSMQL